MDVPLMGELEPIRDRGHHLDDSKGTMTSGAQFASGLFRLEIVPIKPNAVANPVLRHISVLYP